MALIKNITNAQGVTATYHRLNGCTFRYNLDHSITAVATLASYLDQTARTADKLPLTRVNLQLTIPNPAPDDISQTYLYDQIKTLPGWTDATSDVAAPTTTS